MNYPHANLKKYLQSVSKAKIHYLFLLVALIFVKIGTAQTPAEPPLVIADLTEPAPRYTPATVIAHLSGSANESQDLFAPLNIQLQITAGATQGLSKIAVLVGSSEGSSDVFYKEFVYEAAGNFADGTSYSSNGNSITLALGNQAAALPLYAEVFGIMSDGKRSKGKRCLIE